MMSAFLLAASLMAASFAQAEPDTPAIKYPAKGSAVAIELSNGSVIKGIYDGQREGAVWIKQDQGEIGIEPATISSVRAESNPTSEFQRRVAAVDPKDAAALWRLALWASERGLDDSAVDVAGKVVQFAPDHAEARAFLGHEKVGAEWMDRDSAMQARGFVEYKGRWVTRESYEQLQRADEDRESNERIAQLRYNRQYYWYASYSEPYYYPSRSYRAMVYRQAMLNNPTALWEPYRFYPAGSYKKRR